MTMLSGDKVRVALIVGNAGVLLVAAGCLVYGAFVLAQGTTNLVLTVRASPVAVVGLAVGMLAMQALVSLAGLVGTLRRQRPLLVWFYRLSLVLVLLQMAVFIFVLLAGNGVFSSSTAVLVERTEQQLVQWTLQEENKELWSDFQEENECCGFNVRATYNSEDGGYPDLPTFDPVDTFDATACLGNGVDALKALQERFPTYSEEVREYAASEDITLRQIGFLCYPVMVTQIRNFASLGGVGAGVLVFFNFLVVAFTSSLLYSIKVENGGLKPESSFVMSDTLGPSGAASDQRRCCGLCPPRARNVDRSIIKFT